MQRKQLLDTINGSECRFATNASASAILQDLLSHLLPTQYGFIVMTIASSNESFKEVAQNKYGCRVIKCALQDLERTVYGEVDRSAAEKQSARDSLTRLLCRLTDNCTELTNHRYGSRVIRCAIRSKNLSAVRDYIIRRSVLGHVEALYRNDFSLKVVQLSLKHASPELKDQLMAKIDGARSSREHSAH
ncbi:unnamed protein product [Gongylonema pulchrum]|uniref:PUM-HD domain-containing protein n=1 Tax=Gongylonema pulchrum TaxID=637853 RepID=A0A183D8P4_9BILA|nr:unnamed protein product [Gongylonema pulchrum]